MARARDERHRYGQHYTPPAIARLLAAFAIRAPDDIVFDPSCGDGRLLEEALKLKKELRGGSGSIAASSDQVFGVERSPSAVRAALRTGACVSAADFFDVEPGPSPNLSRLPTEYDAIIGNPPYIRQELIGPKGKRRIENRLARDRATTPDVFWPRWSGRSDIYVYFFAHSIPFLKKNGRLVFLTASSWLDAGYGRALREFLLKNFRVIAVIESAAESFFANASINTCITVLEREADSRARENHVVRFVRFNRALRHICGAGAGNLDPTRRLAVDIGRAKTSSNTESYRIRNVAQSELAGVTSTRAAVDHGWGRYLRADDVFFRIIEGGGSRLQNLSTMANVRFGVKTGANEFFYVKTPRARQQASKVNGTGLLALADVASVRRGITTGANEFFYLNPIGLSADGARPGSDPRGSTDRLLVVRDSAGNQREIEAELLTPVVFSLKEIAGILLERVEARRMLFNCSLTPIELAGTRALDYICSGERVGYHRRPTCLNREPWYSVTRNMKPAPLIFPSKVGERWLVALNRAGVFEDKKLYGVFPGRGVSALLLGALLNSTWARYYAESTCRQMTGAQAIADIDVAVAEQILLPDPRQLSQTLKKKLEAAVSELSRRPVYSIFEEIKRADRLRLDSLTFEAIGFRKKTERDALLGQLYEAVTELVRARLSRSRPV